MIADAHCSVILIWIVPSIHNVFKTGIFTKTPSLSLSQTHQELDANNKTCLNKSIRLYPAGQNQGCKIKDQLYILMLVLGVIKNCKTVPYALDDTFINISFSPKILYFY